MTDGLKQYAAKFDALSLRERALIGITLLVVIGYLWWYLFAAPQLAEVKRLQKQNSNLQTEIDSMNLAAEQVSQRIENGVHEAKQQQLESLQREFERINQVLQQKTLDLIEPDRMFELMQQMIFRESRLTLTGLKRKSVQPVFDEDEADQQQGQIYRHVMQVRFHGSYQNILNYISSLEQLEWKLIWDGITLQLDEYPRINVEIEISTLSDSQQWVGL